MARFFPQHILPRTHARTHARESAWGGDALSLSLSWSGCHVLSDGVSSPPADEPVEALKTFQEPVVYVVGLPGFAIPLINAAWLPT